jgi:DNA-binding transcriptional LysR family regulator
MNSIRLLAIACVFIAPTWSGCRAQAPQTGRRAVHHIDANTTLVELGDTLLWIRGPDESVRRDSIAPDGRPLVMVALLTPDSTFVLWSGKRTPMNPALAKHIRALRQIARDEDAGKLPVPSP